MRGPYPFLPTQGACHFPLSKNQLVTRMFGPLTPYLPPPRGGPKISPGAFGASLFPFKICLGAFGVRSLWRFPTYPSPGGSPAPKPVSHFQNTSQLPPGRGGVGQGLKRGMVVIRSKRSRRPGSQRKQGKSERSRIKCTTRLGRGRISTKCDAVLTPE